jgi:hypothetical protein
MIRRARAKAREGEEQESRGAGEFAGTVVALLPCATGGAPMSCSTLNRLGTLVPLGLAASLLAGAPAPCPGGGELAVPDAGRPAGECDDGTSAPATAAPRCDANETLAVIEGRWSCVEPGTCKPSRIIDCGDDRHCAPSERCDPCGARACPGCSGCVPACVPHGCATEIDLMCVELRPECPAGEVGLITDGCWRCIPYAPCRT